MKEIGAVAIALALIFGATLIAVGQCDDRDLFVPPPDAVAEGFVREIMTGRYDRARTYLAEPQSVTDGELRAMRREGVNEVEAETASRTDESALVTVRIAGKEWSDARGFELVFRKEWKIVLGR